MKNKTARLDRGKKGAAWANFHGLPDRALKGEAIPGGGSMALSYGTLSLAPPADRPAVPAKGGSRLSAMLALLLLPAAALALVATLIANAVTPLHAARADLMIHMQQPGDAVIRYYTSQSFIIKSPALLDPIAAGTQRSFEKLNRQVKVDFPKGSNIMRIQVEDQDPDVALAVLRKILAAYEVAIAQVELDESAGHQVVSAPALLERPVFPVHTQFAAIGAAAGLMLSMAAFAISGRLRSPRGQS